MKKRILSTILSIVMLVSLLPTTVLAVEEKEAKWGASVDALTESGTLAEAVAAAASDSGISYIQLQSGVTLGESETLTITSGSFTLDLNGQTVSGTAFHLFEITGGTVTIDDTSENGKISGTSGSTVVYISGGTLNLVGGRLESISADSNAIALYISGSSTVNISGGEVYAENTNTNSPYPEAVSINSTNSSLTVSGGSIAAKAPNAESSHAFGIRAYQARTLSITGGSISATVEGRANNSWATGIYVGYDNAIENFMFSDGSISASGGERTGGIAFYGDQALTISGGLITLSNAGSYKGAVYSWNKSPVIAVVNNAAFSDSDNFTDFYIYGGYGVKVNLSYTTSPSTAPTTPYKIYISPTAERDFTSGWSSLNVADTEIDNYFTAPGSNQKIIKNTTTNELRLVEAYTITFSTGGYGTAPDSQKLLSGEKVTKPEDPVREGYGLNHWCTKYGCSNGTTCENSWDFDNDTVTASDTLYAVWERTHWEVDLYPQGGDCDIEYAYADKVTGKLASLPEATRAGYIFNGWFDAREGGNKITTETVFTGDTRVYAQWTAYAITQQPTADNEYEVIVNPSAGVTYTWHEITETAVTTENADVYEDEGCSSSYTDGWWSYHSTEGMGTPGYFSIDLNAGDTVEVELSRNCEGTVRIQYFNEETYDRYQAYENTNGGNKASLVAPAAAKYDLYVSVWDSSEQPTVKAKVINAGEAISGQITNKLTDGTDGTKYVAKITYPDGTILTSEAVAYIVPTYTVSFNANGGTSVDEQTVENGGMITQPTAPTKTGYTFAGWYKDSELETAWNFNTDTVTEPTTLYAKWTEKATITISDVQQQYDYSGEPIEFNLNSPLTGFTVKYRVKDTTTWSDSIPTEVNIYDVEITRAEDADYKKYEMTFFGKLVINKAIVNVPTVASKVYTGENLTADIPESELYTEISNEGRTDVGTANVVLKLVDSANYKWSDGTETAEKTIEFEITKANVNAITGLDIEGWTYGETTNTPSASATFGTPSFTYVGTGETNYTESTSPPTNAGTYKVIAKVPDTTNYAGASDEKEFSIAKAQIAKPSADNSTFTYTGSEQIYNVAESDKYTVTGNKRTDAGTYNVTVKLNDKANYEWNGGSTDDLVFYFTIGRADAEITIYGDTSIVKTYGDIWELPTASSTFGTVIKNETEVDLKNVGTYTVTYSVMETPNYNRDTKTVSVTINPLPVNITWENTENLVYDNTLKTINAVVANKVSGDTINLTVTGTTSATEKGEYTATVTAVDNSNYTVTNGANLTKSWAISETTNEWTEALSITGWTYGESANAPTAAAKFGEIVYTYADSVDGAYSDTVPTTAGTYYVKATVAGTVSYAEISDTKEFVINKKELNADTITAIADVTYTGEEIKPVIEVKDGDTTLVFDTDYKVTYQDNVNAGTAKAVVAFKGNYTGTLEKEFTILPKKINPSVTLAAPVSNDTPVTSIETDEYTATVAWSPVVTDKFAYSTEYTATVTITPKTNYTLTGIAEDEYTIEGATVTNATDSGNITAVFAKTGSRPSSGGGTSYYTVTFNTDGGSKVESQRLRRNAKATEPAEPTKDGFNFEGWYTDKNYETTYDFDKAVTKGFTLYAKWVEIEKEPDNTDTHNCPSKAFDDLDVNAWYHEDTDYVIENSIFKGVTEKEFAPNSNLTRAMLVTVLYRVEGEPATNRSIPFADIDMGAYYANAVIWAQQNGIVNGVSETEFAPNDNITREQIAAIMHRYAKFKGYDVSVGENTNILSYDDFDSISEYAISSMQYAVGSGLMKGKTEYTLNPLDNATRAEIAAILHRFIEANK